MQSSDPQLKSITARATLPYLHGVASKELVDPVIIKLQNHIDKSQRLVHNLKKEKAKKMRKASNQRKAEKFEFNDYTPNNTLMPRDYLPNIKTTTPRYDSEEYKRNLVDIAENESGGE